MRLVVLPLLSIISSSKAFIPSINSRWTVRPVSLCSAISSNATTDHAEQTLKPCSYKNVDGKWKSRVLWDDLKVGDKLSGFALSELIEGKTGPKLFFECGLGRIDAKGKWQMVSGMLRVGKKYTKPGIIRKKVAKLSGKSVDLYVYRIFKSDCRLEVKLIEEGVEPDLSGVSDKKPISSFKVGQEVTGKVIEVRPYGCLVDVGANRHGILHIQRVADLYQDYIDKEEGLKEAGLEKGFQIKLCVLKNENKRLSLDFTNDTKKFFDEERAAEEREAEEQIKAVDEGDKVKMQQMDVSDDEDAAWAAYALENESNQEDEPDDEYDEEDDDYDEDREIESALGLDYY